MKLFNLFRRSKPEKPARETYVPPTLPDPYESKPVRSLEDIFGPKPARDADTNMGLQIADFERTIAVLQEQARRRAESYVPNTVVGPPPAPPRPYGTVGGKLHRTSVAPKPKTPAGTFPSRTSTPSYDPTPSIIAATSYSSPTDSGCSF